ncbi:MAG: HlyD family secretion protein, partial [Verrucomicrobia bacterium]|nr:HlyD family secretion protein [Verrucomicrobiota bacterium]
QLKSELADVQRQQAEAKRWFGAVSRPDEGGTNTTERFGLLQLKKDSFMLRASADGYISRVLHVQGEVIPAGESVVTVVVKGSTQIIGFLPEIQAHDISVGMKADILHPTRKLPPLSATVTAMGPEILPLPGRVSPVPGQVVRGRRVILVPDEETDFLPGEAVSIQILGSERRFGFPLVSQKNQTAAEE